ncbi:hypothetical protein INT45_000758 [Circinella minor]|uniref:Uncharacterized protein n=1 Tax=Circinella minor TaxID=1195481 RepID=A0A8H7S1M3_9FUNG|nr:hypothetical protein INT45_000758 [Circinella minor]
MTTETNKQVDQDSMNSCYYLARDSSVSANSMPQFPCPAKRRESLRNQHYQYCENHHQNTTLPRSPRVPSSLSDIIQQQQQNNHNNSIGTTLYHQQSIHPLEQYGITEIPLNMGDNDEAIVNAKQERRQVLHGASSSQTLVAIPTTSPRHQQYFLPSSSNNDNNRQREASTSTNHRQSWRAAATNSIFSILSAPSKINRSTTQHYIFTPPSLAELKQNHQNLNNIYKDDDETVIMYLDEYDEKKSKRRVHIKKPSQRGICNTMTIGTIILVIIFLFAGYPLALHIAKRMNGDDQSSSSSSDQFTS